MRSVLLLGLAAFLCVAETATPRAKLSQLRGWSGGFGRAAASAASRSLPTKHFGVDRNQKPATWTARSSVPATPAVHSVATAPAKTPLAYWNKVSVVQRIPNFQSPTKPRRPQMPIHRIPMAPRAMPSYKTLLEQQKRQRLQKQNIRRHLGPSPLLERFEFYSTAAPKLRVTPSALRSMIKRYRVVNKRKHSVRNHSD